MEGPVVKRVRVLKDICQAELRHGAYCWHTLPWVAVATGSVALNLEIDVLGPDVR